MKEKSLIIIIAENKVGMLANFTKVFSNYDLNIDSLSVSKIDANNTIHRITAYIEGPRIEADKACNEIKKIDGVKKSVNFVANSHIERELGMVKLLNNDKHLGDASRIASDYNASTIFTNDDITILEITDFEEKITKFVSELSKICKIEVMRSGVVATTLDKNLITF